MRVYDFRLPDKCLDCVLMEMCEPYFVERCFDAKEDIDLFLEMCGDYERRPNAK